MPDQMPAPPDGCVYGPWWDDSLQWLAIADDRHGRWLAIYDHEGWGLYDVDFYEPSAYFVPELLRLAKENAELRAIHPSEEDRALIWLIRRGYRINTVMDSMGWEVWGPDTRGQRFLMSTSPVEEARKLGWGGGG